LKVLIADDDPDQLDLMDYALRREGYTVLAAINGQQALQRYEAEHPDIVLLDVTMPKLNGFEVLELLGRSVPVIFTTAYDQYALRAFEVHAVDYLLKPFGEERFAEALSRARARLLTQESLPVEALVAEARPRTGPLERVLIRDGSQVHVIPVAQIDFIEAQDDYVCFKANGRDYLKDQTMAAVEATLDPARFVRIHRSYLLNIERIARVELYAKDSRVAVLRDGRRLPVSRSGYARLSKLL